ncbi:MAG: cyclopropane-fatty-acyl-phospholipid synthase family protein [Bryobacteraceae bacterium]
MLIESARAPRIGWITSASRSALERTLALLRRGAVTMSDPEGVESCFGHHGGLSASITVNHPRFYTEAVLAGTLGVAESYLREEWDCDDLPSLFRIFLQNRDVMDGMESGLARAGIAVARAVHSMRRNTIGGARRNIGDHYDLGNEFFQLFLDESMTYSCGIFETPESSLHDASIQKIDRLCRRLELSPEDHLLEIGTGWGALAVHAARHYGCRVTTTTISRQQYDWSRDLFAREGLDDRITLLFEDYRSLTGRYDKLVSVEMIEAVGRDFMPDYFGALNRLLRPGGLAALQAILLAEYRYEQYLRQPDFIQTYIFPGSHIPSLGSLCEAAARSSDFTLREYDDITPHYAETLRRWRRAFLARRADIRRMQFPERFIRMWDYYFSYCEAGFEERNCLDAQLVFVKAS